MSRSTARYALAVALLFGTTTAAPALADADPSSFFLSIKPNAQLLPTLHATESVGFPEDGREYDYVTKGYFKVGARRSYGCRRSRDTLTALASTSS